MGGPRGPKQLRERSSSPTMAARPAAVPHPPWMTLNAVTGTSATAGSRIQITQFGMTSSGHFNTLAVARVRQAGSRLGEALGFGWCACFPQLADPHFTAIASTERAALPGLNLPGRAELPGISTIRTCSSLPI
jgi:hypothetical protein